MDHWRSWGRATPTQHCEIQKFAMVALGQGGSSSTSSSASAPVQLMVREEPRQLWWPADWDPADRSYAYGAPITRLALTSNALHMAVMDPAARLQADPQLHLAAARGTDPPADG